MVYHALQHPLYRDIETIVRVTRWIPNGVSTTWKPSFAVVRRCASAENRYRSGCSGYRKRILRIEKACGREPGSTGLLAALNLRWALPAQWKSLTLPSVYRYRPRCRRLCAQPAYRTLPEGTELLFARCSILQAARSAGFRRSIPSIPTLTTKPDSCKSRPHQTAGL